MLRLGSALTLGLLLFGTAPELPRGVEPPQRHRVADTSTAPLDTLTVSGSAGTPLVRTLPEEVDGTTVVRYVVIDGPALSGAAGRSFTWIPRNAAPGTYDIRLQATHPDTTPDTLLLQVDLDS